MSDENNFERPITEVPISDFDWKSHFEKGNNRGILRGVIRGEFVYSHTFLGKKYYRASIVTKRRSGVKDIIPVSIPETIFQSLTHKTDGEYVEITGQIYTYDVRETIRGEQKHHLTVSFVAETLSKINYEKNTETNLIFLSGKICNEPSIRTTLSGKRIVETFIAVKRKDGKTDYIPCIIWDKEAEFFKENVCRGDTIKVRGKLQSREYWKSSRENPEIKHRKVVYEVSVSKILQEN